MTIELYIARHGETIQNVEGIIQGSQGGELTLRGFKQTYNLGLLLKEEGIKKILAGRLNRQQQSARQNKKGIGKDIRIFSTKNLDERSYGWIEGKTVDELGLTLPEDEIRLYSVDRDNNLFSDAEPLAEAQGRAKNIIKKATKIDNMKILTVGSVWINNYTINHLLEEGVVWHQQPNASAHYFKLNHEGKVLEYELNKFVVK